MKSAYELAMEKFDSEPTQRLSVEQKEKIAEIDRKYQSKIAEAEIMSKEKMKKAMGDLSVLEQIRNDLAVETASLREKAEREKEKIRNGINE